MMKLFIILGALNTMMAVGTGAFGAHGLENKLSEKYMSVWEKATMYQMYHGLGLLIIGVISGTTAINVGRLVTFLRDRLLQRFFIYLSTYTNSNFRCYYTNWRRVIYSRLVNVNYRYI